jgi:hypothetical protein
MEWWRLGGASERRQFAGKVLTFGNIGFIVTSAKYKRMAIGMMIACELSRHRSIVIVNERRRSVEFRWVVFLTLWTLLIGPILNLTPIAPTENAARTKTAPVPKTKNLR